MKGGFLRKVIYEKNNDNYTYSYKYVTPDDLKKILTKHSKMQDNILDKLFNVTTFDNGTWVINLDFINYFYYNYLGGFLIDMLLEKEPNIPHPDDVNDIIHEYSLDDITDIVLSDYNHHKPHNITLSTQQSGYFSNLFFSPTWQNSKQANNKDINDDADKLIVISKDAGFSEAKLYFINDKYYKINDKSIVIKKYSTKAYISDNMKYNLTKNYLSLNFYIFTEKGNNINKLIETDKTHHINNKYIDKIKKVYGEDFRLFKIYEGCDKLNDMMIICENEPKINEMIISTIVYKYAVKNKFAKENIVEYFGSFLTSNPYKNTPYPNTLNSVEISNTYEIALCMEAITGDLGTFIKDLDKKYSSEFINDLNSDENYSGTTTNIISLLQKIFFEFFTIMYQLKKSELKFSHNDCTINNIFCIYNKDNILDLNTFKIKIGDLDKSSILFKNIKFCPIVNKQIDYIIRYASNIDNMIDEYNTGFFDIYIGNKLAKDITIDVEFVSYYARSARIPIFLSYDLYIFIMSLSHNSTIFRAYVKKIFNNNKETNIIKDILNLLYSIHPDPENNGKKYYDTEELNNNDLNIDEIKRSINVNIEILINNINKETNNYSISNILKSFSETISSNDHLKYIYNIKLDSLIRILNRYNNIDPKINLKIEFPKSMLPDILYMSTKKESLSNDSKLIISTPLIYKTPGGDAIASISSLKPKGIWALDKILNPDIGILQNDIEKNYIRINVINDKKNIYANWTKNYIYIPSVYFRTNYYSKNNYKIQWIYNYNGYLNYEGKTNNELYNKYIKNIDIVNKSIIEDKNGFKLLPSPKLENQDITEKIKIPSSQILNISSSSISKLDTELLPDNTSNIPEAKQEQKYYIKYLKYKKKYLTLKNKFT